MADAVRELFDEFRRDHEVLGRGLHEIATALRAGDDAAAGAAARRLDVAAGPHIAFEETQFYPELRKLIGDAEVDRFEHEHELGVASIGRLTALRAGDGLTGEERNRLLAQVETMQLHTDECGEHFGALGRIPARRQEELLRMLRQLRKKPPRWSTLAAERSAQ